MSTPGLSNVMAKLFSPYGGTAQNPDMQLFFGGCTAQSSRTGVCCESQALGNLPFQIFTAVLHPECVGYLDVKFIDPLAKPLIYSNFLGDEKQIKIITHGIRVAINITKTAAMSEYGWTVDRSKITECGSFTVDSDEYWECDIRQQTQSLNHVAGTCRMGLDSAAVVDPTLRVNGVSNLRIVDASIFPSLPAGNPQATVYAVAEKAAELIIQTYL